MTNTKTNKNKNQFWIIKNNLTGEFMNKDVRYSYTKNIKNAHLMTARKIARMTKSENESVWKAIKTENGIQITSPEWK
jgi:hypothetical protein